MQCISQRIPDFDDNERRELTVEEQKEAELGQLRDEASLARRKARIIEKLLAGVALNNLAVPDERTLISWHVQTLLDEAHRAESRIREFELPAPSRREALREEWKSLQQIWMRAENGQDEITRRQSQIEKELTMLESEMAVAS